MEAGPEPAAQKAIADTDYDLAKANYETAVANVAVCKATIEQNKAALELAEANLDYTKIKSPVDGMIIDRKVDSGQTVASQFQTPEMFKVAPEMEKRIYVFASVDEADIGLIRDAQRRQQPVMFTVDAYPNDLFQGKIHQVRLNPTTTQNVVTYTVVVEAPNADLKLLPGMTASLSFQIDKHKNVLRVPNAALRFYPKAEHVRPEDRPLLEGDDQPTIEDPEDRTRATETQRSATEKTEAGTETQPPLRVDRRGRFAQGGRDRHRPERQQEFRGRQRRVEGWAKRGHGRGCRRSPEMPRVPKRPSRELAANAPRRPAGPAEEQAAGRPDGPGHRDRHRRRHRHGVHRPERQRPGPGSDPAAGHQPDRGLFHQPPKRRGAARAAAAAPR